MKRPILATLIVLAALGSGCDQPDFSPRNSSAPAGAHAKEGPNGGGLVELGDHAYVLEAKIDHDRGMVWVWLYTHSMTPQTADAAPEITFGPESQRVRVPGQPREGSGTPVTAWQFQHEEFELEPVDPKVSVGIGGQRFEVALPHHH